jgi:DedD protein
MDRRLKERLVGATILVVLIVLIVPELLSGPKRSVKAPAAASGPVEILRNVTVDLAANAPADGPASAASAPLLPPFAAPQPAPPGAAEPAAAPVIGTLKAQQQTPPVPDKPQQQTPPLLDHEPATPNSASTGNPRTPRGAAADQGLRRSWALQIGSFVSRANADQLVRRLKPHERSVHVSPSGKGAARRYRVRLGPFADRAAAEQAMLRLRQAGQSPSLIPP